MTQRHVSIIRSIAIQSRDPGAARYFLNPASITFAAPVHCTTEQKMESDNWQVPPSCYACLVPLVLAKAVAKLEGPYSDTCPTALVRALKFYAWSLCGRSSYI